MTDYYETPPPEKKSSRTKWLVLLLLLLLLLGLIATWWSLRLKPGEIGKDPLLTAASAPFQPVSQATPQPAPLVETPLPEPEPEAVAEPEAPESEMAEPESGPAPPPPLFSDARWRETARFTGTDNAGRAARFTAYVLVGDETWTFAKADSIFASGLSEPVDTAFDKLNLGTGICNLTRVIAIGAASVEGTSERNTFLSFARGRALQTAIASDLPCDDGALPTSVLDLGYSRKDVSCPAGQEAPCPEVSAPQRPVAMILVDADDPDTDIGEALHTGITAHEATGASVLPEVEISDYSAFSLR
jgi:hypothetical protein